MIRTLDKKYLLLKIFLKCQRFAGPSTRGGDRRSDKARAFCDLCVKMARFVFKGLDLENV